MDLLRDGKALKSHWKERLSEQFFSQVPPNFQGPSQGSSLWLRLSSASSFSGCVCTLSGVEISATWQLMCHWDPVDSCQAPHPEANSQDVNQQAERERKKNEKQTTQLLLFLLSYLRSDKTQFYKTKELQNLFCLYTSSANINAQFPSGGAIL